MIAQQAPTPLAFWQTVVSATPCALYGTLQTALTNAQTMKLDDDAQDHVAQHQGDRGGPPGAEQVGLRPGPGPGDAGRRALARGGVARIGDGDGIWLMAQRSTSAMRALYQFMNRLIDRLMVR